MSNQLVIATVTAALGYRLTRDVVQVDMPSANVTNLRPNAPSGLPNPGINIFLYQVTPNLSQRNADAPTRRADGTLIRRPTAALDLHYMLSFYGEDASWEPQILLGSTVRTMHAEPVLDRTLITDMLTTGGPLYSPLTASDLAIAPDLVRFVPTALTFEEMSKLWGIFYQMPYVLSVAYVASLVLIETRDTATASLPVRRYHVAAIPLQNPTIEAAYSSAGNDGRPLTVADQLQLTGVAMMQGLGTTVLIDGAPAATASASDTAITVTLPATLQAGVHSVQLLESVQTSPTSTSTAQSNVVEFPLAALVSTPVAPATVTAPSPPANPDWTVGFTVTVSPNVAPDQQVQVALVAHPSPGPSYALDAQPRTVSTGNVSVQATGATQPIASGTYLVQVIVDGVPSPLQSSAAPPHTYDSPTLVVP